MSNVIIIRNGPAGVSTALYTTRAGINTKIIGKGKGSDFRRYRRCAETAPLDYYRYRKQYMKEQKQVQQL